MKIVDFPEFLSCQFRVGHANIVSILLIVRLFFRERLIAHCDFPAHFIARQTDETWEMLPCFDYNGLVNDINELARGDCIVDSVFARLCQNTGNVENVEVVKEMAFVVFQVERTVEAV